MLTAIQRKVEAMNHLVNGSSEEEVMKKFRVTRKVLNGWMKLLELDDKQRIDKDCRHIWTVASPRGSWSIAICKKGCIDVFGNFGGEWNYNNAATPKAKLKTKLQLGRVFGLKKRKSTASESDS